MNRKVTKNIQQLVAQRRAKKIETVRNEVITVNLKDARAKLAESTGAKQVDSPTTPTPTDIQDGDLVADAVFALAEHVQQQLVGKPEATPQAPAPDTASLSPVGEDTLTLVAADISSVAGLESVDAPITPVEPDAPVVPVKKPTRSRSRSKSKAKK
jgi:hypothetical protein